ncbi:beta-ketoacyl-ACP synthase II [Flavilitoribacter nigricans]|uniref:3-oxoacyl-[acyl-carrier-protein] synthase 2 n=1 Tax=Flavilitoribacter nigricans (strain ATCC 23147 / DSM 23189 / NBRC 102662 / NCIMB 1420 / SS-2) TaxID=1122177 RepID=A0A2D0N5T6_FLAN2|nr:beta-ketoacyl-ACP synthase II [Flavilitoribacter nigricans]PHN03519.1 beta-ketoacyl-[acyl-carrier-protein] synthase II [Flavilitoribacter nigricans DSM 23189 = NBRC 102662]
MKRVVITGLGALTPIGNQVPEFWKNLMNGVSGCSTITRFDPTNFKTRFACELKAYDELDHFDRKSARKMDRFAQYGLIATEEAIRDAALDVANIDRQRAGVIYASGIGGFETFEREVTENAALAVPRYNPFFITKIIANGLAGMIAIQYGLQGINYAPVTACASSTQSVIQAFNYIRLGKADLIIAGGSEAPITPASIAGFNSMKAMSTRNEDPAAACRPFDPERDGFVLGEGAGTLILESLEHALKRNARIYAEVAGGGEASDAYHITGTHPDGQGAYLAMQAAVREAGIEPEDLDYINAHATSTGIGDLSEIKAIDRLLGGQFTKLQLSATKSMTGHLLGAAGAIEAIATTLAVQQDQIPPTINTQSADPTVPAGLDLTLGHSRAKTVRYALSNSFGFGGHCAALILKKYVSPT